MTGSQHGLAHIIAAWLMANTLAAYMREEDNMGFQQGNSDVPGVVCLAQELDEL